MKHAILLVLLWGGTFFLTGIPGVLVLSLILAVIAFVKAVRK